MLQFSQSQSSEFEPSSEKVILEHRRIVKMASIDINCLDDYSIEGIMTELDVPSLTCIAQTCQRFYQLALRVFNQRFNGKVVFHGQPQMGLLRVLGAAVRGIQMFDDSNYMVRMRQRDWVRYKVVLLVCCPHLSAISIRTETPSRELYKFFSVFPEIDQRRNRDGPPMVRYGPNNPGCWTSFQSVDNDLQKYVDEAFDAIIYRDNMHRFRVPRRRPYRSVVIL